MVSIRRKTKKIDSLSLFLLQAGVRCPGLALPHAGVCSSRSTGGGGEMSGARAPPRMGYAAPARHPTPHSHPPPHSNN